MSKLRQFANFFVTVESAEDATDEDGPASKPQTRVADLPEVHFEEEEEFDIEALERELAAQRNPAPPSATPPARVGAFSQSAARPRPSGTPRTTSDQGFQPLEFDAIYTNEGLPSELSSEFTVYTIEQLLENPHLVNLPEATKTASLMVALQARNVTVGEVIEDARRRDQALDQHDASLMEALLSMEDEVVEKNQAVQDRINALLEELRVEVETNNRQLSEARELYDEWKSAKVAEEDRLFQTIRHLVEQGRPNPVSVDN